MDLDIVGAETFMVLGVVTLPLLFFRSLPLITCLDCYAVGLQLLLTSIPLRLWFT